MKSMVREIETRGEAESQSGGGMETEIDFRTELQRQIIDEQLVERAQKGCEKSREKLFTLTREILLTQIGSLTKRYPQCHNDSDDIIQETLIRCNNSLIKFNGEKGQFSTYAFRIAHNVLIDQVRKNTPILLDDFAGLSATIVSDDGGGPSIHAQKHEIKNLVREILEMLKPNEKEILLRYMGDGHTREYAKEKNIRLGTALVRLHNAKNSFRKILYRRGDRVQIREEWGV